MSASENPNHSPFFRNVVKNGNSLSLNLSNVLEGFDVVRVTIIKKTKNTVTIKIEDTKSL